MRIFSIILFIALHTFPIQGELAVKNCNYENIFFDFDNTLIFIDTLIAPDSSLTFDSLLVDSTSASDSTKQIIKVDTLNPIQYIGYSETINYDDVIVKDEINKLDYRYTGNILPELPFGFTKDLGWYGQPNETMLYGLGFGEISYLTDGISENNRITNSLDLNLIQSEYLACIEYLPLPLGFFYNSFNNPVTVNFITRDKIAARPYTRIKFHQAPVDEGYIDGIFNAYLMNRLNLTFEFTNGTVEPLYENSGFSKWQFSTKLRYMPNNWLNIIAGYSHTKSETHLNGGIDLSWATANTSQEEIDNFLYDPLSDNVIYKDRYQKNSSHNYTLRLLGNILKSSPSELAFYYQTQLTEFRQNEKGTYSQLPVIIDNNEYNLWGITARQIADFKFARFDFKADYEHIEYNADILKNNLTRNKFSLGGRIEFLFLKDILVPSFYVKNLHYAGNMYSGFGADISLSLSGNFNLYAGLSNYKRPFNLLVEQYIEPAMSADKQSVVAAQAGIQFRYDDLKGAISVINFKNDNSLVPVVDHYTDTLLINEVGYYQTESIDNIGINIKLDYNLWNIFLSNNISYYLPDNGKRNYFTPEFTIRGGIYYIDTLFNDNLKLKTGFNYTINGIQDYSVYDFEKNISANYYINSSMNSPSIINPDKTASSFKLDFFAAGQIQDAAIVYIVFENLLNNKYYLIPYYPMFGPALRIGLAWEFID